MSTNNNLVSLSRFKNICFIGLNKVEFHPEGGDPMFAENWLDITDEQSRRNMMLGFFSPRDLHGEPMDPASTIIGDDLDDITTQQMLQEMKSISMFDFCRSGRSAPNTMYAIIVADVIFHWDSQDNYIQPTSPETWPQDLELILKTYPRTTKKNIYTNWDTSPAKDIQDIELHPLLSMPINTNMWINRPTLQEKYGDYMLLAGVLAAALAYTVSEYQQQQIIKSSYAIKKLSTQTNQNPDFRTIVNHIQTIESYSKYQSLFSLIFKDISLALADTNFVVTSYILENPNPKTPPDAFITKIKSSTKHYATYEEQEPIAKKFLSSSLTINKIRKPPITGNPTDFMIEGLIPLEKVAKSYLDFLSIQGATKQPATSKGSSK